MANYNGLTTPLVLINPATGLKPSLEYTYGPYDSIDLAYTSLIETFGQEVIPIGLTVGIKEGITITEYWFNGGTSKENLMKKNGTSDGGAPFNTVESVPEDNTTWLNQNFPNAIVGEQVVDTTAGNLYIKYSDTGWIKILGTVLSVESSPVADIVSASIMSLK